MIHRIKALLKKSRDLQRLNDWIKISRRKRRREAEVRRYLEAHTERRLHLGCGTNLLPGWLNTDSSRNDSPTLYLDVTERMPLPDASIDYILAEHIIEHIDRHDAEFMLRECHRVLRPNGVLRVGTPDLPKYLALYAGTPDEIGRECIREIGDRWIKPGFHRAAKYAPAAGNCGPVYVVNDIFLNYEHRFIYDQALLQAMMQDAGFTTCLRGEAGTSRHAPFHGVETHVDRINTHLTLTIEASKAPPSTAA